MAAYGSKRTPANEPAVVAREADGVGDPRPGTSRGGAVGNAT